MRRVGFNAQTTLNNRIAHADGSFWEPFSWGDAEQAFANKFYGEADTWIMSRPIFDAVVPWWDLVAAGEIPEDVPDVSAVDLEFAARFAALTKVAISRTRAPTAERPVMSGDTAAQLAALKEQPGRDILLTVGPATLDPLLAMPGLIDELLLMVHPAVISNGPRLFGDHHDLRLRLIEATPLDAGAIVMHYEVLT